MIGWIAGVLVALVVVGTYVAQIVGGIAMIGLDHFVEREKSPGPYWFIIAVEGLMLLVGVLSFLAFQLGIFV